MTLDNLAIMVAKGFEQQDEKIAMVDQNLQVIRRDILQIGDRFISRHEFDAHVSLFNALENKVKNKLK